MFDPDDGDRLLTLVGVALVAFIVVALGVLFLAASDAGDEASPAPDAEWELTRVNETHVRVAHAGGEPVGAEHLLVTVDGRPRRVSWPASRVGTDDGVVVPAESGSTVALYWERPTARRAVLARWQLDGTAGVVGTLSRTMVGTPVPR